VSPRGPLHGYRALDLTDHRGALAGRLLADLGVDVVKLEPRAEVARLRAGEVLR
jgi:crotonobetainyl-CoA:carnitine CoA-transferase CaiB-like acyl-CoA transferase